MQHPKRFPVVLAVVTVVALIASGCGSDDIAAEPECPTITLATHDSFALSDGTLDAFTEQSCVGVNLVASGDAGQLVSAAILTVDNPTADVLFGVDNALLNRALDVGIFDEYRSPALDSVSDDLELDDRVTPISYGDVCVNYWTDALPGSVPTSLDDLIDPVNAGQFVTQDPETSSPGFAFLLATIAKYGEDGWEQYWQDLVANDVTITSGWSDAYYGEFTAGGGDRAIVTSYASSPAVGAIFAEEQPVTSVPTGVLDDSCFRQIEFAGILEGSAYPKASRKLIDFMLSRTYQDDIPGNMFVYPALNGAVLPDEFEQFNRIVADPLILDPDEIEENRERWTARWREIVLG